jgi:hypothetical protein
MALNSVLTRQQQLLQHDVCFKHVNGSSVRPRPRPCVARVSQQQQQQGAGSAGTAEHAAMQVLRLWQDRDLEGLLPYMSEIAVIKAVVR